MSTTGDTEVTDRLRELEIGFATLSATLTTQISGLTASIQPQFVDHEARIRKLDADINGIKMRVALIASAIGTVGGAASAFGLQFVGG